MRAEQLQWQEKNQDKFEVRQDSQGCWSTDWRVAVSVESGPAIRLGSQRVGGYGVTVVGHCFFVGVVLKTNQVQVS